MTDESLRYELVGDESLIELAVLCETALIEASGALSIVRVINRMVPPFPDMPYVSRRLDLALLLVQGRADPDTQSIQLDLIAPDGTRQDGIPDEFTYPSDQQSLAQIFVIDFTGDQSGVYWFELWLNGRVRKRLPLQVWIPALASPAGAEDERGYDIAG